ncbi:MAG TPA: hypothetical protein VJ276_21755 [Thermoanaerobaculia bacterium]|nr:hypothetical protein [Thermoanaerobaculia bacterium]
MLDTRRAARAATSVVFPIGICLAIGVPAAIINLVAVPWIARPWSALTGPQIALAVFLGVVFPIAWFVLGFQYGMARAVFHVYAVYRERVAELVIERLVRTRGVSEMRDVPLLVRRAVKIALMLLGAGDRVQDVVTQARLGERPEVDLVAAMIDDALLARSVEPLRWALIITGVVNAAGLIYFFSWVR